MADHDPDNQVSAAIERLTSFHKEIADHPRRRPFGALFQARDNRELEQQVMTHFYYSMGEPHLGLRVEAYLEDGRDPPDYRCRDQHGRVVGIELVELVDQDERRINADRLARTSNGGTHEHSLRVPQGATPGFARMLRERTVMRMYQHDDGLGAIASLLNRKDAKIGRKRRSEGKAWDYDQIIVLVFTNNWTIAEAGFYQSAQENRFGPFNLIERAFLVSEPFFGLGDGIIELPIVKSGEPVTHSPR